MQSSFFLCSVGVNVCIGVFLVFHDQWNLTKIRFNMKGDDAYTVSVCCYFIRWVWMFVIAFFYLYYDQWDWTKM